MLQYNSEMSYSGSNSSSSFNSQNRPYVSKNKSSYKSSRKGSHNGFSLPRSSNNFSLNNLENLDKNNNNNTNFKLPRRNRNNKNNRNKKNNRNGPGRNERRYLNSSPIPKRTPARLSNNNPRYYSPSPVITRVSVAQNGTLKATLEAFKRLTNGFPGILSPTSTPRAMWTPQRR